MDTQQQERQHAIAAIRKKLVGKAINYEDAYAIMHQFVTRGLEDIFVAYFTAAGFKEGYSDEELYFLTKAMVETGKTFSFSGTVADKHSIGGLPGTRATLIIVPIIAAAGYTIPKTSSRAITTPAGTADCMEVLAPVDLPFEKISSIINRVGGCIVWGGHLGIAPADDIIIRVEEPIAFESYDKIIISILAKKVAASSNLLILDIPVGPTMKMHHVNDAKVFAQRFKTVAERFNITVKTDINHQYEPAGRGVGPSLEVKDALMVLEQHKERPMLLEHKALKLASRLLDLCFAKNAVRQDGLTVATEILHSGKALKKFQEIVEAQGGNPRMALSDRIKEAPHKKEISASHLGTITAVNNYTITTLAKILGAPWNKTAGIFLHKRFGEKVSKNDILMEFHAEDEYKLEEAVRALRDLSVYTVNA